VKVAVVLVAAGSGSRLGADVPKAFVAVGGRPILDWAVRAVLSHPDIAQSVVVVPAPEVERLEAFGWQRDVIVVAGGAERHDSVRAGLAALADSVDYVLVHDAARPFVPPEVFDRVIEALLDGADAVIPGVPLADTVKRVAGEGTATIVAETVSRRELVAVQTPQGFRRATLERAHLAPATATEVTDDASLVERSGGEVRVVAGSPDSFKITTPNDLLLAEALTRRLPTGRER
jgi:2-C-methyl-D-erythritol 4-phosphate cytidylyltransferase